MHLHCLSHPASHQFRGNASVMRLVNRGLMSLDGDSAADVIFLTAQDGSRCSARHSICSWLASLDANAIEGKAWCKDTNSLTLPSQMEAGHTTCPARRTIFYAW